MVKILVRLGKYIEAVKSKAREETVRVMKSWKEKQIPKKQSMSALERRLLHSGVVQGFTVFSLKSAFLLWLHGVEYYVKFKIESSISLDVYTDSCRFNSQK